MIILLEKDPENKIQPGKYRPIALLDTLYKVYTSIQSGSQKSRTTGEQVTSLLAALEDRKQASHDQFAMIFVDIIKAYDSVEH
jgi:hypothetical protein